MEEVAKKVNVTQGDVQKKILLCIGQLTEWIQKQNQFKSLTNN